MVVPSRRRRQRVIAVLAAELVERKGDVIVASTTPAARAAHRKTQIIPMPDIRPKRRTTKRPPWICCGYTKRGGVDKREALAASYVAQLTKTDVCLPSRKKL